MRKSRSDRGFSLVELAVSMALVLVVTTAALSIVGPGTTTGRTQPEVADLQQRARAGGDQIARDLYRAGAGVYLGPAVGPLRRFFAPVVPRRMGLMNADAYTAARSDAVTIVHVPDTFAQTVLQDPLPSAAADLRVALMPNCPPASGLCGLAVGSSIVIFDAEGHFDFFTLTDAIGNAGRLRQWQQSQPSHSYQPGAVVAEARMHSYYFDAPDRQLRHFDGYLTDMPVVDNVVGLSFTYFGDPLPPRAPKPPPGVANCLYDATGAPMPGLAALPSQGSSDVELPLSLFRDGPWCGDGENRFDADLLRVAKVRVNLRLQVGNEMLRGRTSDFVVAGRSLSAPRSLSDYSVQLDVAPRNLGWDR